MADVEKAFLEIESGERLPCLFNPAQLAISRSNTWAGESMPGRGVPRLRYAGARPGSMAVELFFDTTTDGTDVTKYTGKILALMEVDSSLPGSDDATHNARPPYVTFHWGNLHSYKAVIAHLDLTFTYFSSTRRAAARHVGPGPAPVRAVASLRTAEPDVGHPAAAPRAPGAARARPSTGSPRGTTGTRRKWRTLAVANGIEDPLALRPGAQLSIPRLEA